MSMETKPLFRVGERVAWTGRGGERRTGRIVEMRDGSVVGIEADYGAGEELPDGARLERVSALERVAAEDIGEPWPYTVDGEGNRSCCAVCGVDAAEPYVCVGCWDCRGPDASGLLCEPPRAGAIADVRRARGVPGPSSAANGQRRGEDAMTLRPGTTIDIVPGLPLWHVTEDGELIDMRVIGGALASKPAPPPACACGDKAESDGRCLPCVWENGSAAEMAEMVPKMVLPESPAASKELWVLGRKYGDGEAGTYLEFGGVLCIPAAVTAINAHANATHRARLARFGYTAGPEFTARLSHAMDETDRELRDVLQRHFGHLFARPAKPARVWPGTES